MAVHDWPDSSGSSPPPLAPHPTIPRSYSAPEHKRAFLNGIFDETAPDYDRVERWLSLGSGRWYRRKALARAGLQPGMRVADIAVGTGLVAGEALKLAGPTGNVVGVDPSPQMMRRARERLGIETFEGTAESLPLLAGSFDFLSMGYALRHVDDLNGAFREFHRVLNPGGPFGPGRLCILEITRPRTRAGRAWLYAYLGGVSRLLGAVARLSPRTPELWQYYWETIDRCLPPELILESLRNAGFSNERRHVVSGIFSEYTATRA
ncbi:MAG: class I SAM-dependent methyltransferase [Phycisphaeraceae bacterium]|nr:class I SAM-dependent methyltransferase [Phycisphaeraceae bacterium]